MDKRTEPKRTMDRELVSQELHELEYLARIHGASVDEVKAVISEVGSRSRKRVEEELDKRYTHRSLSSRAAAGASQTQVASRGDKPSGGTGR